MKDGNHAAAHAAFRAPVARHQNQIRSGRQRPPRGANLQLDEEVARFGGLLDADQRGAARPSRAPAREFASYTAGVRETAGLRGLRRELRRACSPAATDDRFVHSARRILPTCTDPCAASRVAREGSRCQQVPCAAPVARPWRWRRRAGVARLCRGRAQHFPAGAPADGVSMNGLAGGKHRSRGCRGPSGRDEVARHGPRGRVVSCQRYSRAARARLPCGAPTFQLDAA